MRRVHCLDHFPLIMEDESHVKGIEIESFVGIKNRTTFATTLLKLAFVEQTAVDFENEGKPGGVIGKLEYRA